MNGIWIPVAIFAALGALMGILLAVASRVFAIKKDPRIDEVQECLPGANCGGCGYAGCAALAEAIVRGDEKPNACVAGGDAVAAKIGAIMGVEAAAGRRMVAQVMCSGTRGCAKHRFDYEAISDCHSAEVLGGGDKFCAAGCIGCHICEKNCPSGAISLSGGDIAAIDPEKCTGCGLCAQKCPRKIIKTAF